MAERSTDPGEDPGLEQKGIYTTFEKWDEAQQAKGIYTSVDDDETGEIFSRGPEPPRTEYCKTCHKLIDPENSLLVWVADGPRWSPFCNVFCREAYNPSLTLSID